MGFSFHVFQLFSFEMGGGMIVAVSGFDMVHHLWVTEGKHCSLRSPCTMSKYIEETNPTYPGESWFKYFKNEG